MIAVMTVFMLLFSTFNVTSFVFAEPEGKDPDPPTPCEYYTKFDAEDGKEQSENGISVVFGDQAEDGYKTVSWTAIDDIQVRYVFVKAGSEQSNDSGESGIWYDYTDESAATGLTAPDGKCISHVSFYYDDALPDLSIVKTASPTTVEPGDEVTYTIEVTNNGADATGVNVVDVMPNHMDFVAADSDAWDHEPGSADYTHSIGELASGDTVTITFKTVVSENITAVTEIPNTAKVNCEEDDDWKEDSVIINVEYPNVPVTTKLTITKEIVYGNDTTTVVAGDDTEFTGKLVYVPEAPTIAVAQEYAFNVKPSTPFVKEGLPYGKYQVIEDAKDDYVPLHEDPLYVTISAEDPEAIAELVNKKLSDPPPSTGTITIRKVVQELTTADGWVNVDDDTPFFVNVYDDPEGEPINKTQIEIKAVDDGEGTISGLPYGTYYVVEVTPTTGYTIHYSETDEYFDTVTLSSENPRATATIVNRINPDDPPPPTPKGTITVIKQILNSNETTNTDETREFIIRVKNTATNAYKDFTLKNGALEGSAQFDLGEYEISETNLPPDYDVYIYLSEDSDEDGKVDLAQNGDEVTVTVINMKKYVPVLPTISKDDGGVRVYPGDTITYNFSVDLNDYDFYGAYLIESPDPNTEYIPGESDEWEEIESVNGRKTYKYNIYQYVPMFARSEYTTTPEIPEFKVRVKSSTPRSVDLVTNYVTLYFDDESEEHVTDHEDTPILHRNDDDDDDDKDDKDDDKKDDPGKPDLVVTKTDKGAMVSPGALVEYFITVENKGNAPAEGVKVYETVPAGAEFVAGGNTEWVLEDGKYVYDLGLLNVGDKREVKFVLKVNNPFPTDIDKILNEVEVKDNGTETATTDNKASDHTPVITAVPVIADPPVVTPPTPPILPVVTEPATPIPDLPFTGGSAEVELMFAGMGILLMAGGIVLKKRK
jgi:uncharacterized repeat protein (TIGR01451 family)